MAAHVLTTDDETRCVLAVAHQAPMTAGSSSRGGGEGANAARDLSALRAAVRGTWSPLGEDLLDIATCAYLADIGAARSGPEEADAEVVSLVVPVRVPHHWSRVADRLSQLHELLTGVPVRFEFRERAERAERAARHGAPPPHHGVDCVCLLSGAPDSFAGAAMLIQHGRRPLLVSHQSGNPALEVAQREVVAALARAAPGAFVWAPVRVAAGYDDMTAPAAARTGARSWAQPLLTMSLGVLAAYAAGVRDIYHCENGVLTMGLAATTQGAEVARLRGTSPEAAWLFSQLLIGTELPHHITNPLLYRTKGEGVRRYLKPLVAPADILRSVSCWACGRLGAQCGCCVSCVLRRIALLSAGLPEGSYLFDVMGAPEDYRETEARRGLLQMLREAMGFLSRTEAQLMLDYPGLVAAQRAGVNAQRVVKTLKRYGAEVYYVLSSHFPSALKLCEAEAV